MRKELLLLFKVIFKFAFDNHTFDSSNNLQFDILHIVTDELDYYDVKRHKVVVDDNIEIEDESVQDIYRTIDEGFPPRNAFLRLNGFFHPFVDLLVSVLVFANDQSNILRNTLDFFGETIRELVVDIHHEHQSDKTFDDHDCIKGLTNGKDENHFCEEWRNHLQKRQQNV